MAEVIEAGSIRIQLDVKNSQSLTRVKGRAAYFRHWEVACAKLGKAMGPKAGPYGLGAFTTYSCDHGAGMPYADNLPPKWLLNIVDGKEEARFSLKHLDNSGYSVITEFVMPASTHTLEFFADDEFTDMIAYALLDASPMGMLVTKADVGGSPPQFTGRFWRAGKSKSFKYDVPEPPVHLSIYRLRWDDQEMQWRSEAIGDARQIKVNQPKEQKQRQGTILIGGGVVYETSEKVVRALASGSLWAKTAAGPDHSREETTKSLRRAQIKIAAAAQSGELDDFLAGRFDAILKILSGYGSGFAGIRYGREVLLGEGGLGRLLRKTSVFQGVLQIRNGPTQGLRYSYDVLPRTTLVLPGIVSPVEASIESSRHTLGYSYEFDPHLLVDKITIEPKVGAWTFKGVLPITDDERGLIADTANFALNSALSLGFEVGLEELSDWYLMRQWYRVNTGFSLHKSSGRVVSNQFGVDAFFTGGPRISLFGLSMKSAIMAFYFCDAVDISLNRQVGTVAGDDAKITAVGFTVGYAGIGAALSW